MILENINSPSQVKTLGEEELKILAHELREEIISVCSKNGGHIAPSLGVVELTLALLKSFDIENNDRIIWDVGHQSYSYKLLTGRKKSFSTLRQLGGISGFPSMQESKFDFFGAGHAGTSVSAALGMSLNNRDGRIIAVIGDASISNGMAFEGLNHAGALKKDIIVILNDNEMSISKNVGAISNYLNKIMSGNVYQGIRNDTEKLLKSIPLFGSQFAKIASKLEESIKNLVIPGILFEELGFTYIGPIDGHSFPHLLESLENIKNIRKPVLLHVVTQKGKGYDPSEKNPSLFHGISAFDKKTGLTLKKSGNETLGEIASNFLIKLARKDKRVIGVTAAMADGTGLTKFSKALPERFFDVGMAEEHAVTFAAGAAASGLRPFVFIYSTFIQRALDQIIHDICLQGLPVVLCLDRAGIAGEDGATHQGIFDVSFLGFIPNLVFMTPADEKELMRMLKSAVHYNKPVIIRYPKADIPYFDLPAEESIEIIEEGNFDSIHDYTENVIVSLGYPHTGIIKEILDEINHNIPFGKDRIGLINARFVSPVSKELVARLLNAKKIMTVEENVGFSGFGSKLLTLLLEEKSSLLPEYKMLSLGNNFIEHGPRKDLLEIAGFSSNEIKKSITQFFNIDIEKSKIGYSSVR